MWGIVFCHISCFVKLKKTAWRLSMDRSENQATGNNTKDSGKSLGDLLRALNSFQDSLGEMMDENDVAEFTFKENNLVFGTGYRIAIPDGFKINLQSVSQSGQRDFLAWIPSENEKKEFVLHFTIAAG